MFVNVSDECRNPSKIHDKDSNVDFDDLNPEFTDQS
jgi:hypothetical protein